MTYRLETIVAATAILLGLAARLPAGETFTPAEDDGYRGIWYSNQKTGDKYVYKYSGGMPTYPQQHLPIAHYVASQNKTFFVYGGSLKDKRQLLHMVSCFDHATKTLPRPRILLNKETTDAHDNPTLTIDRQGHLWIFSNSHGTGRPSYIHKSTKPYAIDEFERVVTTNFSYSQPWTLDDGSFILMHTLYQRGHRVMHWMTSRDGRQWNPPQPLAHVAQGHYQVSWSDGQRVATTFNYHPEKGGLNARTNLYFLQTADAGRTWTNVAGESITPPLDSVQNPALVHDYQADGKLVYLKQLQFDPQGNPLVLFLTSKGYAPGPEHGPHAWHIARWQGGAWRISDVVTSDHNYDFGSLYFEPDGTWRLIAPTEPGAQPYCTGGDMVAWTSADEGQTWTKGKQLTRDTKHNHSFARAPLHAHPDFYAIWGSGHAHEPSPVGLYFTDRAGSHVWRLPEQIAGDRAVPEVAW